MADRGFDPGDVIRWKPRLAVPAPAARIAARAEQVEATEADRG